MLRITFVLLMIAVATAAAAAAADDRSRIGTARLFNNDALGDHKDRWRTGSYSVSYIRGPAWSGELPSQPGQIIEYRFRSEIIAPADLTNPVVAPDRRYAGILSLGVFTHFNRAGTDYAVGLDMVATGPSTGMGGFQDWAHTLLGYPKLQVLGSQLPNAIYPTLSFEASREMAVSASSRFRPFFEAQAGVETYVRVGGDLVIGDFGRGDLQVRDTVTGHRVTGVRSARENGGSFVFGGDVAWVGSSAYLPSASGYTVSPVRSRLRAGFVYEGERADVFYGATWLSPEFAAQPASQIVGSLSVRLRF